MNFPTNSLGAFAAGFGVTSLFCSWLCIYILGWYEAKWSPGFNLVLDTATTLVLLLPLAALCFAFGAYAVNSPRDPWQRSLLGGALLSLLFFGATRFSVNVESDTLGSALVWSTLIPGSIAAGAWARFSMRPDHVSSDVLQPTSQPGRCSGSVPCRTRRPDKRW